MQIDVKHIAKLAKLGIPEEKLGEIGEEMGRIVAMVENLPPLEGGGSLLDPEDTMQLRPDEVQESYPREAILQNAPHAAEGYFLVPKTVD